MSLIYLNAAQIGKKNEEQYLSVNCQLNVGRLSGKWLTSNKGKKTEKKNPISKMTQTKKKKKPRKKERK